MRPGEFVEFLKTNEAEIRFVYKIFCKEKAKEIEMMGGMSLEDFSINVFETAKGLIEDKHYILAQLCEFYSLKVFCLN